jgi:hypothetical protein
MNDKRLTSLPDWGRVLVRLFGIANWFYGLTGAYFLVGGLWRIRHFGPPFGHPGRYPHEASQYYFLVTINAIFVLAILLTGYWLILIRRRGVVFSNYLFSMEILFWVLEAIVSFKLLVSGLYGNAAAASFGQSLAAVSGIGNMGTALQLLTAYPVIALVALNLARKHLDRKSSWNALKL